MAKQFYAAVQFYEPFTMGGNVWQWRKYAVDGSSVKVGEFNCFLFKSPGYQYYYVHECKTGVCIGEGKTKKAAVEKASENVDTTPDLKEQMKQFLDENGAVESFIEVAAEEVFKRLNK